MALAAPKLDKWRPTNTGIPRKLYQYAGPVSFGCSGIAVNLAYAQGQKLTAAAASFAVAGNAANLAYSPARVMVAAAGSFTVTGIAVALTRTTPSPTLFPLAYSADSRYLVGANAVPFPIKGRTAWFITSLTAADYQTFLGDCLFRGYNAIEFHVINHDPRGHNPPANGEGQIPFLKRLDGTNWNGAFTGSSCDFTTPNEAYWAFVDTLLAYCDARGILCFMFPAYVGYGGGEQGWMVQMVDNGTTKMQSYGAWIANRYKNQKNIIWMMGGDSGTGYVPFSTAQRDIEQALLSGLQSVGGQQSVLMSAEWGPESISPDQADFRAAMTLDGVYCGPQVAYQGHRAYAYATPVFPAYLMEEPYDEEGADGNSVNLNATQPVRRFQWWGWLTTIGGDISGNGYVWPFNAPAWQNHLDTQGSRDMARLNAFIDSLPWYRLKPSGYGGMMTLITAGNVSDTQDTYVAAAATSLGDYLVAYIPPDHGGSITVAMTAMRATCRARWYDPTSAVYTDIGNYANVGTRAFTPTGANSRGEGDWVLILDAPVGGSLSLSWTADPNAAVTGYRVYYGTASGTYYPGGASQTFGNVTSATLTGLVVGTEYFLTVVALVNGTEVDDPSGETSMVAA